MSYREAYIGRSPMRRGGLRLETEVIGLVTPSSTGLRNETSQLPVVHCYGAGPNGFKVSWGAAKRVCKMVEVI